MTKHSHTSRHTEPGNRRILVVANGVVDGKAVRRATGLRIGDRRRADVRLIAPALNSRLRHWLSDEDEARRNAGRRLAVSLESLSAAGIDAHGAIGDADPLQAIADALVEFRAEEIVIATQPGWRSHWATRDIVGRTRRRFAEAIVHPVIEPNDGIGLPGRLPRVQPNRRRWLTTSPVS